MSPPTRPSVPAVQDGNSDPVGRVRDFVAEYSGGGCMLAMVAGDRPEALKVDGYAGEPAKVDELGREVDRVAGRAVETRAHPISAEQCSALGFANRLVDPKAPALLLTPDQATIDSGQLMEGSIDNFNKPHVYLLVVDDDGKVEEVKNLFMRDDGAIGFSAPMTLTDGPVATEQLLVAIGSDEPLETIEGRQADKADVYFAALADEIVSQGRTIEFGMTSFVLRQP